LIGVTFERARVEFLYGQYLRRPAQPRKPARISTAHSDLRVVGRYQVS
jgi:hypothetical protein